MRFWDIFTATFGFSETPSKKRQVAEINSSVDFKNTKISIQTPIDFRDITNFVRSLSREIPLIVNFGSLKPSEAERSLDFVCGAVCALNGKLERIGEGIYFYAPQGMSVETDKKHKGKHYGD